MTRKSQSRLIRDQLPDIEKPLSPAEMRLVIRQQAAVIRTLKTQLEKVVLENITQLNTIRDLRQANGVAVPTRTDD